MSWIKQIKNSIGRFMLNRTLHPKGGLQSMPTFDAVHDIGILYHAGSKESEEQVNRVAHYLRDQGKKVWTMGFVDAKTLPHTLKFHISSEYFWLEKLNWYNLPDPTRIGHFLTHRFDLMMNLYFDNELPLQAMSAYSQANFSMGAALPDALKFNDTVIDTGNEHSLQNLATQMVHYLKVINQK